MLKSVFIWIWKLIDWVLPPKRWRLPVFLILTSFLGIGIVIFVQSRAHSYLFDDPTVCVNCHVMTPQYVTWTHSSHYGKATCNDCYIPHDNILNSYLSKAMDGSRHTFLYTFRMERQAIQAVENSQNVIQNNCVRCHGHLNTDVSTSVTLKEIHAGQGKKAQFRSQVVPIWLQKVAAREARY